MSGTRKAIAALVLLLALAATACGREEPVAQEPAPSPTPSATATPSLEPPPAPPPPAEVADPVTISIPAIDVNAQIVEVGLADNGAMEVPDFGLAAWYTEGPKPGEPGPSVVVAHVDSRSGPDVFYRLRELAPGAEIDITREDGTTVSFTVESSEQTDKDALPTDKIWNDTDEPVLRLITCGGAFNNDTRHYEDNIIVYANPVAAR